MAGMSFLETGVVNRTPWGLTVKPSRSNVLNCGVCESGFDCKGDRIPRLLFCGHTLCHSCLLRLPSTAAPSAKAILCPFDRQPTDISGPNGVLDLKKNFALIEVLEKADDTHHREPEPSIACDEDGSHAAEFYCTTCASHLCAGCSESTHSTRTLAKHLRIPLSEKPTEEKPRCPHHPSHGVEFACLEEGCRRCGLMSCHVCKEYGRHKGHSHNLLELEAETLRSAMSKSVEKLKAFMESAAEANRRLHRARQQIVDREGASDDAKRRIQAHFRTLRHQLDAQEVAAMTVVDAHVRDRLRWMEQRQEENEAALAQVAAVCVHCDCVTRQDDARVVVASTEIREMLENVNAQIGGRRDEQQQQQLPGLDPSIPITFTRDNVVHIGPKVEMRLIALGLDGSGKTSILFKLKQQNDEFAPTIPTIGFNVEEIEFKNIRFTMWDVGGLRKIRSLWKHYFYNTQAVIFVLDSSNRDRLTEAQGELAKLLSEELLKDACFLVLANKQDVPGCVSADEIARQLSLHKICCGRPWHVQACDAKSGAGLFDGLDWLSRQLVVSAGFHDVVAT